MKNIEERKRINQKNHRLKLEKLSFLLTLLPSTSYTYKFYLLSFYDCEFPK